MDNLSQLPNLMVLEKKIRPARYPYASIRSMGIDERDVVPFMMLNPLVSEDTYSKDIFDLKLAKRELLSLADRVARRMRRKGLEGKTITLKVKYHDFVPNHPFCYTA